MVTQGVEPTITTRGRRRPQRANSAQGAGRPRITTPSQNRKKGRGWHTNRAGRRALLVSRPAISCRDPKRFEPTIATRGSRGRGDYRGVGVRCCTVALLCCAALLCCTVALLCCAALCYCSGPRPRVTTLSCAVLYCCVAVLLRCCTVALLYGAVLLCCTVVLLSGGLIELQPSR